MIFQIKKDVYREIREYGQLKPGSASEALGRGHQIISRLERDDQMPTPELEAKLVKAANLSPAVFVEIMCRVLTKFQGDGRQVVIMPPGKHLPISPVLRAGNLFDRYQEKLSREQRDMVERLLTQARITDDVGSQTSKTLEDAIRMIIRDALAARGERLPDDDQ